MFRRDGLSWRPKSLTIPTGHHHSWRRTGGKSNHCSNDHTKTQKPCIKEGASAQERAEQSDCITSRLAELDMHSQECGNAEQFARNSKIRQENAAQIEGIVGRHCRCRWSIKSTYVCVWDRVHRPGGCDKSARKHSACVKCRFDYFTGSIDFKI
jgi:hypothetical protein